MRSLLTYVLLFAVLLPSISPWGTLLYYRANKDYIARVLCENRDKPQLHCDGKCYLAKKLKAQQDKQDKETTERIQNMPTTTILCRLPDLLLLAGGENGRSTPRIYLSTGWVFGTTPLGFPAPLSSRLIPTCLLTARCIRQGEALTSSVVYGSAHAHRAGRTLSF